MDALMGILAVGGLFFWVFTAVAVLLVLASLEKERGGWATFIVLAFLVGLQVFSDFKPFTWIAENPVMFIMGLGAYIVIGVAWTFFRWYLFSLSAKEAYADVRAKFVKRLKVPFDVRIHKADLANHVGQSYDFTRRYKSIPLQPGQHLHRIWIWMVFWPLDGIWTIINDPVVRLFRFIYNRISGALTHIGRRRFKGFEEFN